VGLLGAVNEGAGIYCHINWGLIISAYRDIPHGEIIIICASRFQQRSAGPDRSTHK